GEIGIVLERPHRLDHVDSLAAFAFRQLATPDRRVERAREIDPRQLAAGVVGGPSGYQQVADGKVRAGAVVERAGGVFRVSHRATLAQGHWAMKQTASILLPSGSRTKAA